MELKHIVSLLILSIILIVLYFSYGKRGKRDKKNKKSVKENFIDEMMREDNSTFSLFNWSIDENIQEHYAGQSYTIIVSDPSGNLDSISVTPPLLNSIKDKMKILTLDATNNIVLVNKSDVFTGYPNKILKILTTDKDGILSSISSNLFNPCKVNSNGTMNGEPQADGTCKCRNNWSGTTAGSGCDTCDKTTGNLAGSDCQFSKKKECGNVGTIVEKGGDSYKCTCVGGWSQCSEGSRTYTIQNPDASVTDCTIANGTTEACGTNCSGSWSQCSQGSQTYSKTEAKDGGKTTTCESTANGQTRTCGVNCVGSWGACRNGSKTYRITTAASGGGKECPYKDGETSTEGCDCGYTIVSDRCHPVEGVGGEDWCYYCNWKRPTNSTCDTINLGRNGGYDMRSSRCSTD